MEVRHLQRLVVNLIKKLQRSVKRTLGPKIWNSLSEDVKDLTSLPEFTEFIKAWYGPECKYNICKYLSNINHYT